MLYMGDNTDVCAVNLGRWILRFLFARLIDEELERDTVYRKELMAKSSEPTSLSRQNAPPVIQLPTLSPQGTNFNANEDDTAITPRALNGIVRPSMTPGLSIGIATPHHNGVGQSPQTQNNIPTTIEEGTALEKRLSQYSQPRSSSDRQGDYFTSSPRPMSPAEGQSKAPVTPDESSLDATAQSPNNPDKEEKSKDSRWFNKKFPMNFPKKLGRSSGDSKPAVVDEKSEESDKSDDKDDKTIQDNLFGAIQKIRYKYEEDLISTPSQYLQSRMRPSTLSDTPGLQLPPYTSVIIQEERPDSGGVADLYRGAVISVGQDADLIEQKAPMWLGEILLLVKQPLDISRTDFGAMLRTDRIQCLKKKRQKFLSSFYHTKIYSRAFPVQTGRHLSIRTRPLKTDSELGILDLMQIECYEQRKS